LFARAVQGEKETERCATALCSVSRLREAQTDPERRDATLTSHGSPSAKRSLLFAAATFDSATRRAIFP